MNINAGRMIKPEQLGETIQDALKNWSEGEEKKFFQAIDKAANRCNDTAKNYIAKGNGVLTGTYRSSFRIESEQISNHHHRATWYVDAPEYRLTHLLENGHAKRNGGRTRAVKHIKYGRQIAEQVLDQELNNLW